MRRALVGLERGHNMLKARGIALIAASAPTFFLEDTPTVVLVRQVLGAIAQFEKAGLVAKLAAARKRKRVATGKCEGRKSHGEKAPGCRPGQGAQAQAAEGRPDEPSSCVGRDGQARLSERARCSIQPQSIASMLAA
jgi:DNA invertase Pin-like site-specific DNA recombinase